MASLPGLGNSLDSRAERRSWARLSGCGVWSWAMVFSGIGCLQLGGCENHAVGPRLPPALQGTAPAVQAVCAIVGAGSLEHLRLRLRYECLLGAPRPDARQLPETGGPRTSIGRLTKDVQAIDLSRRLQELS